MKKWIVFLLAWYSIFGVSESEKVEWSAKIERKQDLGRYLFFDQNMSYDRKTSCASCHDPKMAFTDGYRLAFNARADQLKFNTSSLLNLTDYPYLSWSDSTITDLNKQMRRPLFSETPIEHGLHLDSAQIFLEMDRCYGVFFRKWYDRINVQSIVDALAQYLVKLESRNAPVDNYVNSSNCEDIDPEFERGWNTFHDRACHQCHGGRDFNLRGQSMMNLSLEYRIPSLRNVRLTAPYFHDGRTHNLSEAIIAHPNAGGRKYIPPSEEDTEKILHFLNGLTDTSYLSKEMFCNPFN